MGLNIQILETTKGGSNIQGNQKKTKRSSNIQILETIKGGSNIQILETMTGGSNFKYWKQPTAQKRWHTARFGEWFQMSVIIVVFW